MTLRQTSLCIAALSAWPANGSYAAHSGWTINERGSLVGQERASKEVSFRGMRVAHECSAPLLVVPVSCLRQQLRNIVALLALLDLCSRPRSNSSIAPRSVGISSAHSFSDSSWTPLLKRPYLSRQACSVLKTLKECCPSSSCLHPARCSGELPIGRATLNKVINSTLATIRAEVGVGCQPSGGANSLGQALAQSLGERRTVDDKAVAKHHHVPQARAHQLERDLFCRFAAIDAGADVGMSELAGVPTSK